MAEQNPYQPPQAPIDLRPEADEPEELPLAGLGARLLNVVIDSVARIVLGAVVFVAFGVAGPDPDGRGTTWIAIFLGVMFGYYIVLEYLFGRTLGKLITGTRVVTSEDARPTLLQILGRTFLRHVPLEPLTVLFSSTRSGLHDWMSGTCVVRVRRRR